MADAGSFGMQTPSTQALSGALQSVSTTQSAAGDVTTTASTAPEDYSLMNHVLSASMTANEQGDTTPTDFSTSLGNFASEGLPLTAAAVFNSFYNTAVEVGNIFGGDFEKATIAGEFGPDSDMTKYYDQHSGTVEGAGLVVGSLLPGLGAVKLLKGAAMAGRLGETMQIGTRLLSATAEGTMAEAAVDLSGNAVGTSLFGLNNLNKTKAVLAAAADNAIQGAVFQTATLATMHASPLLDSNTMADNVSDVINSAAGFGLVGGIFQGAGSVVRINRATRSLDLATKGQEIVGSSGLGNLTPGDRIVNLDTALGKASTPNADGTDFSNLQQMKLNFTTSSTNRQIATELLKASGNDQELATALQKFYTNGKTAGQMDDDTVSNLFTNLTKVGRHGDSGAVSFNTDAFYPPSSVAPADLDTITHADLMHPNATAAGNPIAKAYQLTDPNTLPVIGKATDTDVVPLAAEGLPTGSFTKFNGAMDAYSKGVDIYLDAKGGVHINPKSPTLTEVARPGESRVLTQAEKQAYYDTGNLPADSKPLNSTPLVLELGTGKLYGEAPLPVVGDIGKPELVPQGLKAGDAVYPQSLSKPLTTDTAPMSANARYVWAAQRGLKAGDSFASTDLPMLEQLYREQAAGQNVVTAKSLSTTDGVTLPTTAPDTLQLIAETKQKMLGDLLGAGKNADEIGHILNAPQDGLVTGLNTSDPAKLMIDPGQHEVINHVRLAYDIGTTKNSEGNLLRGLQNTAYRTQLATEANTSAVSNYLARTAGAGDTTGKTATDLLIRLQVTKGAQDADILGAGAGLFSNANADYGTAAQQFERVGRATSELLLQRNSSVSDALASAGNAIRTDPAASAEWGNFIHVRRMTPENYVMLDDATAAANGMGKNTAILEGAVTKDTKTGAITIDKSYIPKGFVPGGTPGNSLQTFYNLSDKVTAIEKQSQLLNNNRNELRQQFWQSQGISKPGYNPDVLYAPPVNTSKQPFLAYVRQREGYAFGESGASVITARSQAELQSKIAQLGPDFDAFTKNDIANFKKAQGEYEYNRNFASNQVDNELARKGILNNLVPETRGDNLITDIAGWHMRQEAQLLRDHVELLNAKTFAQLRSMGERFDNTNTSRFGAVLQNLKGTGNNPYQSYIRTALNVGEKDSYPLWQAAQEKLQAFGDTAFNAARSAFGAARKGILPMEEAAKVSEKFGLGNPYGAALDAAKSYYGGLVNQLPDAKLLNRFTATANSTLGATVIRLDTFQQLIHAVTTPIMASMEYASATGKKALGDALSVTNPVTNQQVPGFTKVLFRAIGNYFGPESEALTARYAGVGLTRDEISLHRQMIDQLSIPLGKLSDAGWAQKIDNAATMGEKLVGTRFVNKFNHFIVSDIGRQLAEAQGQTGQEALDTIGTFTNRALGNMTAGQRATIFSGPVGQAVGLFQSYQMNLMQQLLRHVGNGDTRALMIGAGMQASVFGASSLPGFSALNNLILERHGNIDHADMFSATPGIVGKTAGDYLLYGSLSGLLGTALYSRGDLNPRRATILPVNPMNFPSVAAGTRIYQTLAQLGDNLSSGASVPASLMLAAEHNGLSRPLTGLAELMQGFVTDPKGNMIASLQNPANASSPMGSNNAAYSDLFSIANMSRLMGARPLDESIGLDAMYRNNAAKVKDAARMESLGQAAKAELYNGGTMAPEQTQQFMANYVRDGGNQAHFNSWMLNTAKQANVSVVNKVFDNFRSPTAQTLQRTMGGIPLPDARPQQQVAGTGQANVQQPMAQSE